MMRLARPVLFCTTLALLAPQIAAAQDTPAAPRPVYSEIVSADPTRQRAFSGVIEASRETILAFQTDGRLATLNVSLGDVVSEGDILATLDRVTLQESLDAAQAAVASAQAEADYAESSYQRVRTLIERDITTLAKLEQAQANRDAKLAQLAAARADLTAAEEALDYGILTAPSDGVILSTQVEQGTVVDAGTPIAIMAGSTGRDAVISVPTEFLAVLPEDAEFLVYSHTLDDDPVLAPLRLIEPVADDNLRSRRLRLSLDGAPERYRIGGLISAQWDTPSATVITVPKTAITGPEDAPQVWRIAPDTRQLDAVAVTLGTTLDDRVVVTEGLAPGDEFLAKGANSVTEGQIVGERIE